MVYFVHYCSSRTRKLLNKYLLQKYIHYASRHTIIKMPKVKDKERILKSAREKQLVIYRGVPIRLSADFSKETLQARRGWREIVKVRKRLLYPAKLSFRIKGQAKSFPDKKKPKEFITTKPLLQMKTMNNKMAINTYLSTIESKKQTKLTRRTETESWIQRAF